jgi:serine/threonine protein phosphatase PrpC
VFADTYRYFGVFDGHHGSRAAKFAAKNLHAYFDHYMQLSNSSMWDNIKESSNRRERSFNAESLEKENGERWTYLQSLIERTNGSLRNLLSSHSVDAMLSAFALTNQNFIKVSPGDERSGTTATVALLFGEHLLISHVGDSRAVLCCDEMGGAIQLTIDHTPYNAKERARVEAAGGHVSVVQTGGVLRVDDNLAVTRSIGDKTFASISAEPDTLVLDLSKLKHTNAPSSSTASSSSMCSKYLTLHPKFMVVASDGLWDVMSNDEACDIVCDYLASGTLSTDTIPRASLAMDAYQNVAKILALEGYVRGSSDNIGVCVIEI